MSGKLIIRIILGVFLLLLGAVILPFTPVGNDLLKPYIQKKIDESSPLALTLDRFRLGFSSFDLTLQGAESLHASLQGNYSLFAQSIEAKLALEVKDLGYLSKVAAMPLQGAFRLDAKASGDRHALSIVGESDIAHSETKFLIDLKEFSLHSLIANIKHAQLESLLRLGAQPPYAKAILDLDAKLTPDSNGALKGEVELRASRGEVNGGVVQKEFGITIPATLFDMKLTAALENNSLAHNLKLTSNVGGFDSLGTTNTATLTTDSLYTLSFSDLSPLTPVAGIPLRGALKAQGTLKGNQESLLLEGETNLAASSTHYRLNLQKLAPYSAQVSVKNLKLERLLYMLHQPPYLAGDLALEAALKDLNKGISGTIDLQIPQALTHAESFQKELNLALPATKLALAASANLTQGKGEARALLDSPLARLEAPQIALELTPALAIETPYTLQLPDLQKLAPLTKQKLYGALEATGKVRHDSTGLSASFLSRTLGGEITGNLRNDDLNVKLAGIEFVELLQMLGYPQIFNSKAQGDLAYNLAKAQGTLALSATEGRFKENQLSAILRPFFGIDLTKEVYQAITLDSQINQGAILSDLFMKSQSTQLRAQKALIDTNKNQIDATLEAIIKNHPAALAIKGALDKPKISLDSKGLVQEKAGKLIDKHLDKRLDKHLPSEVKEPVKNLLKGLF